ncbi:aspartic proteinase NANA, chloroplast-like [Telopea speciosissima]|uniref:aspartic proteinase NANA, chloroplast-like n=1 Tax=Telopea speciosissima TaxID=54955 RepID=UPI001CC798DE|nr:aspartic proteinase NANA, chloroplast-like [Telopea speciosissima]
MIHRHDQRLLGEKKLNRSESLKELMDVDKNRMEMITHKLASSRRRATQLVNGPKRGHHGPNRGHHRRPNRGRGRPEVGHGSGGVLGGDNSSFSLPIRSGAYAHQGQYFVTLKVGTPAQLFLLVIDTGSGLTWIKCSLKNKCNKNNNNNNNININGYHKQQQQQQQQGKQGKQRQQQQHGQQQGRGKQRRQRKRQRQPQRDSCSNAVGFGSLAEKMMGKVPKRMFFPERSRTFRTVPCSSKLCRVDFAGLMSMGTKQCPTPKSPCAYSYSYADTSYSNGIYAYESVTVILANGTKMKLHDMLIGCTNEFKGSDPLFLSDGDGVFGLGGNTHAFGPSVVQDFDGKFSYCLMDRFSDKRETNYLTFGNRPREEIPPNMQYTKLGFLGELYAVPAEGIYVDGVKLKIPAELLNFEKDQAIILDSGSTLTFWVKEIYDPLMEAFEKPLLKSFPKVEHDTFASCFKVNNNTYYENIDESLVPKFEIQFQSGARFSPPPKSYFMYVDANVNCIGFQMALEGNYHSVLGNIMQQNHIWEFDPNKELLGFAPSTCVLRHHHRFL